MCTTLAQQRAWMIGSLWLTGLQRSAVFSSTAKVRATSLRQGAPSGPRLGQRELGSTEGFSPSHSGRTGLNDLNLLFVCLCVRVCEREREGGILTWLGAQYFLKPGRALQQPRPTHRRIARGKRRSPPGPGLHLPAMPSSPTEEPEGPGWRRGSLCPGQGRLLRWLLQGPRLLSTRVARCASKQQAATGTRPSVRWTSAR
mmetsp:Transcript_15340/g.58004  ORF Transcript_15340/g.58004 Transcript_15340/m.58004 type:complete len:200 (-) Transcript_15340:473-1072(-)